MDELKHLEDKKIEAATTITKSRQRADRLFSALVLICLISISIAGYTVYVLNSVQTNQHKNACIRDKQAKYLYDFAGIFNTPIGLREGQIEQVQKDALAYKDASQTCK